MIKLTDISNFPDGTPIDAIQGKVTAVYPARSVTGAKGTSTVQNAELSDVGGNKIRLTVWDHPDLNPLKDNEYVLHNNGGTRFPGIKVKHGSYVAQKDGRNHKAGDTVKTLELNVTKNGVFQHVEVYNQSKPAGSAPAEPVSKPATGVSNETRVQTTTSTQINGASVGMAIKAAIDIILAKGREDSPDLIKEIHSLASAIVKIGQSMEKGDLCDKTKGNDLEEDAPF